MKKIILIILIYNIPFISFYAESNRLFYAEIVSMAEVVKSSASAISALCEGIDSEKEQLEIILRFTDAVRFLQDKSGYLYVYDYDGLCIAHAIQKDIVGKNLAEYRDSNGKYVIRNLSETAKKGGGFLDFRWQKPDGTPDKQKVGYVAPIENTRYFIGSGVYLPDNCLIIAFAYAKPPFVSAAFPLSYKDYDIYSDKPGIELEMIKASLETEGYSFFPLYYSYNELEEGLSDGTIEIAATVRNNLPNIFYSEEFVYFHNIIITKRKNSIEINTFDDLRDKSIVAWEGASKDLGDEFQNAVDENGAYREVGNQEEQGALFFNDKAEVLVIDKTIFEWWISEFSSKYNTSEEYIYHNLFPEKTKFYIGFRSEKEYELFSRGFSRIKKKGIYEKIYSF